MICLVNIDVDDIEKGVDFYGSVFGLKVGRRFGSFGAELLGSSAPIYLLAKGEGTAAAETTTQRRTYARHWTPVHLDFVVEDSHSAVAKAVAAEARLEGPIATHSWGMLASLADPFGHGFCFVQFLGQGYDAISD